ncbi:MAG: Imm30 family immunity protein [Sphingomonas sp.]
MEDGELNELRRVARSGGSALMIDDALLPVVALDDPKLIPGLLELLSEEGDQDGMWSILHVAENFAERDYVRGLLDALPTLARTSKEWASVLVIRVLNSGTCRIQLATFLRHSPPITKGVVAGICDAICREDIGFAPKAASVLAAARE